MLKKTYMIVAVVIGFIWLVQIPANARSGTKYNFTSGFSPSHMITYNGKTTVTYKTSYRAGTIIVDTSERALYFITGKNKAIKYGVGVGKDGYQWSGANRISRKAKWPSWTPPPAMLKREPHLPKFMPGGINNPLGARALYLGGTIFRIHGTNEAHTIGYAMSSGCIRMLNSEVKDLYDRVKIGALVVVRH